MFTLKINPIVLRRLQTAFPKPKRCAEKALEKYFTIVRHQEFVTSVLTSVGQDANFDVSAKVHGGGIVAQAEAIRLGISRALVKFNPELKKSLRDRGFMTRDARKVERKKPGLKKARKSPQWAKR